MKFTSSKIILLIISVFYLAVTSCSKKQRSPAPADLITLDVKPYIPSEDIEKEFTEEDGLICIVFAPPFNEKTFQGETLKKLENFYGNELNGGKILALTYPDDFSGRISSLYEIIDDKKIRGLLLLGAPDNTHRTLGRIQDFWEENVPYNIISLFPNDNTDGQESTCNLVFTAEDKEIEL
ncbi:MAG: hypothetical protein J5780_07040, partial [Treponema sp.]|nr:hypothetical protein [Treponema sp.]